MMRSFVRVSRRGVSSEQDLLSFGKQIRGTRHISANALSGTSPNGVGRPTFPLQGQARVSATYGFFWGARRQRQQHRFHGCSTR